MAYTTINKHTDYFDTKTFTGNASSQSITGLNFKPSLVWLKNRDSAYAHSLFDLHRGTNARIRSESSNAQDNPSPSALTAFNSDGFTVGGDIGVNQNNEGIVGWNWYAADTAGSSNTDGSLNSYATTANTTAGFSIVSYTGTGSATTVGHGLGVEPAFIIIKGLSGSSTNWQVYSKALDADKFLEFNSTTAELSQGTYNMFNSTRPTSTVFSLGTHGNTNASGVNYIAYCFAEKTGYSKVGSYTGNGNNDGSFIYTGFKPSFAIFKRISGGDNDWILMDNKRDPHNLMRQTLYPNLNNAEAAVDRCDFLSNGIKLRGTSVAFNASGSPYIYMAFGQSLVGSNNTPCTAR